MTNLSTYRNFIASRAVRAEKRGFEARDLPARLFGHQSHMVRFACEIGSAACFYDTGLGKTAIELAFADQVARETTKPVMVLAPLAVGPQTAREADAFGIDGVAYRREPSSEAARVVITNYERLKLFDPADFGGVVLDESSIIKSFTGKVSRSLIETWARHPYRMAATATPAPNDHMELGQHSAFLRVMPRDEMLTRWFVHDSMNTKEWRLKGHAVRPFWRWVASWAQAATRPSDVGDYPDDGYDLPPFKMHRHMVRADVNIDSGDMLFRVPDMSATSLHKEKRLTVEARAQVIADLVSAEANEPWIIWCDTDYEADALKAVLPTAIEVRGSQTPETKERLLTAFSTGQERVLITKPSVAGWGLNWQHCARVAFVGLSYSYEQFYQAIRRCWRFGQTRQVQVHVALADTELAIWDTITRKRDEHHEMSRRMVSAMREAGQGDGLRKAYAGSAITLPTFMEVS